MKIPSILCSSLKFPFLKMICKVVKLLQLSRFGIENARIIVIICLSNGGLMRSFLINKNLSLYYVLRRKIGKRQGFRVASIIQKALLLFGREKIPGFNKNGVSR